jgi:CMP/dCMP kinase
MAPKHHSITKKHIITLAGKPGSGKSSTAREVAKLLHYDHFSAGKLVRQIAKENGLTLEECNARALEDPSMDQRVDRYIQELGKKDNLVIDSRLGFHWIPNSFKVYLELDSDIAIARIYRDIEESERSSEHSENMDEIWDRIQERTYNERLRFKRLYNIDPFRSSHYDLVIHTERNNPMTVALWIHDRYQKWLKQGRWKQIIEQVQLGYSEA